ncbi:RHS repeat-associated core domain-containing protein [Steroidobacter flavus]|uniref:RHS repeat-associated core domain-containing protein n=1 Tax=Steroidobacter flavus TaxID=1842136 RepID=A0ABV8SZH8_9GAMM
MHYIYENGRLIRRQVRPGGIDVYYDHDAAGRISAMRVRIEDPHYPNEVTVLTNVLYGADGRVLGWTWGNGTLAVREYDEDGRVVLIDSNGQSTYTYDDASRITAITTDGSVPYNMAPSWTYGYDDLDRLTGASRAFLGASRTYAYDANGNRTQQGGTNAVAYTYDNPLTSNQLTSITGSHSRSYAYDAAGNLTSDGLIDFTYDGAGRMIASSMGATTYGYNGRGQRTTKRMNGELTGGHYVYDEEGHLIEKCLRDAAASDVCDRYTHQQILWLEDIPVATALYTLLFDPEGYVEWSFTELFNVHTDHLNTPRRLTRADPWSGNQMTWAWRAEPFGVDSVSSYFPGYLHGLTFDLRFPGQLFDAETGLNYNNYRDYDPSLGRYVQSDPLGLGGGINTYGYVSQNPVSRFDPWGLTEEDVNIISDYIDLHFPDIDRRGGYSFDDPNPGARASTDKWTGVTSLSKDLRCKILDFHQFNDLVQTMFHESMHSTDSWWQGVKDGAWDAFGLLSANHSSIYNRVQYEFVARHRYPTGPTWGTPSDHVPDIELLYWDSRHAGNRVPCDCK